MAKTTFEKMGGSYTLQGDYYLPNLTLPDDDQKPIGVWGRRHSRFLKQNHKVLCYNILTAGKLNSYLADIDEQAEAMFSRLVKQLAQKENIIEKLKAENPMLWVGKMNNIRNRAMEVVNAELIYTV